MSLTTREYVLKMLGSASESLGLLYTKQTSTSLQLWCTKNRGAFVANMSMIESREPINQRLDMVSYRIGLYFVISRKFDLNEEEKTKQENDSNKLANQFLFLLKSNDQSETTLDGNLEPIYREGGYLGMGMAGVYTISLADRDDNCDLFCDDSINNLDCD